MAYVGHMEWTQPFASSVSTTATTYNDPLERLVYERFDRQTNTVQVVVRDHAYRETNRKIP